MKLFRKGRHRACCESAKLRTELDAMAGRVATAEQNAENWRRQFNTADKDRIVNEGIIAVREGRIEELEAVLAKHLAPVADDVVAETDGEYLTLGPHDWKPVEAESEKTQPIRRVDIPDASWAKQTERQVA